MHSFYHSEGTPTGPSGAPISDVMERVASHPTTAGPWGPDSQHGGPPAALLARAVEGLPDADRRCIGRFTMELLGPVPVGPLEVGARVVRPGRSVDLCEARLRDVTHQRDVARASVWRFPMAADGAADRVADGVADGAADGAATGPARRGTPLPHTPDDGVPHPRPESWSGGYLDVVDWRWIEGSVTTPGPAVVWMRPTVALVDSEPVSPVQRLLACADSASGVSAELDPAVWGFLNTELTVHLLRPPEGEWLCLRARTTLSEGHVGLAVADVYDRGGLVARTAQALLVARR
ncbi:MAG TPA: thioesterase family protein [Nocardioidaceae bacterium]|nr:thioesterase family protein [Nocardioidaceae bacterium]